MGEPDNRDVIKELISALSSLHMEADELPKKEQPDEDDIQFMDEKFRWVKHASEHIQSAIDAYVKEKGGIKNE